MKRNCALLFAMLVVSGIVTGSAYAAVPMLLSHQGRLLDASDQPVTGTRDITFHIYGDSTGGLPLWTEAHLDVPIANGLFHVTLGGSVTISADLLGSTGPGAFDPSKWIVLQIEGTELLPRMRLGSVPSAVLSSRVSGDVETLPGQMHLSGMSGSTTATIRASEDPGADASETLHLSGSTTATIRAASSSGAEVSVEDANGDVSVTALALQPLGGGISIHNRMSGSTTATIRMQAAMDSTASVSGMDLDNDGVVDVGTSSEAIENRNILKSYFETGDKPSQARFVTQYSESDMELSVTEVDELHTAAVSADSTGSELRLLQMPLGGGMSGSTTGTIRAATGQAHAICQFTDGTSEDVTEMKAIRKDITINLRHHDLTGVDGDQSSELATDSGGSELKLVSGPLTGMSGSTTATIRTGATSGGGGGGGGALQQAYTAIGHYSDGTNESSTEQVSSAAGAISRLKGMSGSTTGTIRMMATADSVDREMTFDDPLTGASMKVKEKGARTKCSSNLRFMNPTDSTDVLMECDTASARHALSGMSGSTTGTIRMAASSDSVKTVCEWVQDDTPDGETVYATTQCDSTGTASTWSQNDDADDFPNIKVRVELKDEFGNSRGGMYLDNDSDNDGVSDTEAELSCDESGSRSILSGMSGSTTGTIRMAASPDSAVFDLGISGSTTGTIRIQTSSSGVANPIEHSSGAHLTVGGDWTNASDKNLKENFTKINGEELLEKIEELPISQWNYKNEDESITHIGPTAQDFQKTFGVGSNEKAISTIDPSGIALAAIKELIKQNQELIKANEELNKRVKALEKKQNKE